MKSLDDEIRELPPESQQEVESLVYLLKARRARTVSEGTPLPTAKDAGLDAGSALGWRGALQEMSEEYTSVDLQHKALDWWNE